MKTKNELFLDAVDYLIDEGFATDQGDVAFQAGLGPNLISRVRNGRVKSVSDDSIRALAFKFNLNMDYFRGRSEYITRYDQSAANLDRELENAKKILSENSQPKPELLDYTFMVEKAVEKATAYADKTIAALEKQIADKDHQIDRLEKEVEVKDATIEKLQDRILDLERLLSKNTPVTDYPFPIGVADERKLDPNRV